MNLSTLRSAALVAALLPAAARSQTPVPRDSARRPLDFTSKGLVFSGKHPSENIMQVLELPGHPFFMGCQFHPELTSNLRCPSPLFYHLVKAALREDAGGGP